MAAICFVLFGIFSLTSQIHGRPNNFLYERLMEELFPQEYLPREIQTSSGPVFDASWPKRNRVIGQVGGVAVDTQNQPYVFHRANRTWGAGSFNSDNTFAGSEPIRENTILKIDKNSGDVIDEFGAGMFYMPHGLTIDGHDNIWVTDVALHQVMKIPAGSKTQTLTLGKRLEPGSDDTHFCKPTDVAVASDGTFFVSDGYCNGRIMKFDKDGNLLDKWGHMASPYDKSSNLGFSVPHSVALIEDEDLLCVADREHGRIQCFKAGLKNSSNTGEFYSSFTHPDGGKIFAIAYSLHPQYGAVLYAVDGGTRSPRGFSLLLDHDDMMQWAPKMGFGQPHDVAVSPDGADIYVGDIVQGFPPVTRFQV